MAKDMTPHIGTPLEDFLNRINAAIKQQLPGNYWVRAEILNCTKKNYWSIELGSYDNELQKAKVRATIWASNSNIVSRFETQTGTTLKPGLKILFACSVQFHPEFGISLNITEIDPSFTLGDMELRLNAIRTRLQSLGEFDLNRRLPTPQDFTSVAVISPYDAAGLGDFQSQIEILQRYGLCQFKYFTAMFQGKDVSDSLVMAMSKVVNEIRAGVSYDALIILRGGGDKAGLFQLNEIRIARGVCRCPIPVLVGIGHERDSTILDEIANARFPTPSSVANYIKTCVIKNAREARLHYQKFVSATAKALFLAQQDIQHYKSQIEIQSQRQLEKSMSNIIANRQQLLYFSARSIQQARYGTETTYQSLSDLSYRRVQEAREKARANRQQLLFSSKVAINDAKNSVENTSERVKWLGGHGLTIARSEIESIHKGLISTSSQKAFHYRQLLNQEIQNINYQSSHKLLIASNEISTQLSTLKYSAGKMVSLSKADITLLIEKLLLQDPARILSRGFAYVQSSSGQVITNTNDLHVGQQVSIHMKDGKINAVISGE
jgi:exodeoxyribonuclease VII large subunit